MNQLVITTTNENSVILNPDDSGDALSRLSIFVDYLNVTGSKWYTPDLKAYARYLQTDYAGRYDKPLSASSANIHLATVRARLRSLATDNAVRDDLLARMLPDMPFIEKKALVDELLLRLNNALVPSKSAVTVKTVQDEDEREFIRLNRDHANALIRKPKQHPDNTPLQALRDTAILSLMLATGIREMELVNLDVPDLRGQLGDELALTIREGKGAKQRLVPYGAMGSALVLVERWMTAAGISSGAVFRGFWKGGKQVRPTRISKRAINDILHKYPLVIDGQMKSVNPHDLRRSYARLMFDAGMRVEYIAENLGHEDTMTTKRYIGKLDAHKRRAPDLFDVPL